MKKPGFRSMVVAILSASLLLAGAASAAIYTVTLTLNGAQEVPPIATAATGTATLTIDTSANTIGYNITHNVVGPTAAHIHGAAARDKSAGVLIGFPSAVSPMVGSVGYVEGNEAALISGRTYVNIHSGTNPGGEIRGQVPAAPAATPALSEWGMILLALALVFAGTMLVSRRRRQTA
jgi:hypothetical protein